MAAALQLLAPTERAFSARALLGCAGAVGWHRLVEGEMASARFWSRMITRVVGSKPMECHLYVTDRCNLDCHYCTEYDNSVY